MKQSLIDCQKACRAKFIHFLISPSCGRDDSAIGDGLLPALQRRACRPAVRCASANDIEKIHRIVAVGPCRGVVREMAWHQNHHDALRRDNALIVAHRCREAGISCAENIELALSTVAEGGAQYVAEAVHYRHRRARRNRSAARDLPILEA